MGDLFGGGSSQPNIIIPPAETPRAFQTVIPQKSYKDLAESIGRTEGEINRLEGLRQDMTGTAQQLGAKQRGIEMQEAASYLSSLPSSASPDQSFRPTPREFDIRSKGNTFSTTDGQSPKLGALERPQGDTKKTAAQSAAQQRFDDSKAYYLAAVEKAKTTPKSYTKPTGEPGYAQNPASMYLPKASK
jgi:hypothetical protein